MELPNHRFLLEEGTLELWVAAGGGDYWLGGDGG